MINKKNLYTFASIIRNNKKEYNFLCPSIGWLNNRFFFLINKWTTFLFFLNKTIEFGHKREHRRFETMVVQTKP